MEEVKKIYSEAFKKYGDSPSSVQWPKGRQKERFDALFSHAKFTSFFSVLDFGCGLAHLKEYLNFKSKNYQYTGVDIVEEFLEANKIKYTDSVFLLPDEFLNNSNKYDYVVASGTFSILYQPDKEKHKQYVYEILEKLFKKTNQYLSVNFMTDQVDFIQGNAFHIHPTDVYNFCHTNLSKRLLLNQSYMPYEFTITIWKDDSIMRPENIYKIDE